MIQLARLFLNIQEGMTDQYDYEFLLEYIENLEGLTRVDIEEFIQNNYEEIVTWNP